MAIARVIFTALMATTLIHVASAIAGEATYYTVYKPSACFGNEDRGTMIAAVNEPLWANKAACGTRYRIRCTGGPCRNGEITVTVVDRCAGCSANQFDLSQEAFSTIADPAAGRIRIEYNRA